ncbi:protein phosphatase 2C 29 isoform X2 [Malania oleifera]|uniref:protein phosphatase 2C 29 isoform X2 n=1 Tax=Malania oleifera TaxID=397392 RepID=UPI0025AE7E2B|nr:protein phosphatase 2C 29 isoform X2 [Malania oleifera]
MGGGFSQLVSCFKDPTGATHQPDPVFAAGEALDEALGHSFCYVRSSARFPSPTASGRFLSPTQSLRFDDPELRPRPGLPETGFKAISGASVSANTSTPRTVLQLDGIYDDATDGVKSSIVNGFESTSSFSALPLQPVPRGGEPSGPMERGFFMSGPIERGALSGPLDGTAEPSEGRVPFSAPLGGTFVKKRRKKGISGIRKAFYRNFSEKKRPWVVPVRYFGGRKEMSAPGDGGESEVKSESNVQWALGKAGEDRVHVVVSEEQGWLFVGIYDGFNGPDAPEFLMGNLYRAVFNELEGLFWDVDEADTEVLRPEVRDVTSENVVVLEESNPPQVAEDCSAGEAGSVGEILKKIGNDPNAQPLDRPGKRVTFHPEEAQTRRKRLWEYLAEDDPEDGLDLSGSDRFAFSVDDALSVSNAGSAVSRRWLLLSKLKHGLSKHRESHGRKLFPWKFGLDDKEKIEIDSREEERTSGSCRKRKVGPVDHELVLRALSRALEVTEFAYLDMTDKFIDTNPELALMGSCLLVALMRDEDVYVMNVGDSRAIVAQYEPQELNSRTESNGQGDVGSSTEGIVEESTAPGENVSKVVREVPAQAVKLTALQLSTDHSTSIEEEIIRIKKEHPDDSQCIVNDRVKGRLKVTRAFGAGFLKQEYGD